MLLVCSPGSVPPNSDRIASFIRGYAVSRTTLTNSDTDSLRCWSSARIRSSAIALLLDEARGQVVDLFASLVHPQDAGSGQIGQARLNRALFLGYDFHYLCD